MGTTVVLSPSIVGLQQLINDCSEYMTAVKLSMNVRKTKCMIIFDRKQNIDTLLLITVDKEKFDCVKDIK